MHYCYFCFASVISHYFNYFQLLQLVKGSQSLAKQQAKAVVKATGVGDQPILCLSQGELSSRIGRLNHSLTFPDFKAS